MGSRLELQTILETITPNVYFQPPSTVSMVYPAIRYSRSFISNKFADNEVYKQDVRYSVIVISEDPDSELVGEVSKLPKCKYDRNYVSDNLNHDVFTLYY